MPDPQLDYERQIEDDFIALLTAATGITPSPLHDICRRCGGDVGSEIFPAVMVKADNAGDAFFRGSANSGIMQADVMIDVCTYRSDDKTGSAQSTLVKQVRSILWLTNLAGRLTTISGYTYWAALNLDSFDDPDERVRRRTLQVNVKFSPTK